MTIQDRVERARCRATGCNLLAAPCNVSTPSCKVSATPCKISAAFPQPSCNLLARLQNLI